MNLESEIKATFEAPMLEPVLEEQLFPLRLCTPTFFCSCRGFPARTSLLPYMMALKGISKIPPSSYSLLAFQCFVFYNCSLLPFEFLFSFLNQGNLNSQEGKKFLDFAPCKEKLQPIPLLKQVLLYLGQGLKRR